MQREREEKVTIFTFPKLDMSRLRNRNAFNDAWDALVARVEKQRQQYMTLLAKLNPSSDTYSEVQQEFKKLQNWILQEQSFRQQAIRQFEKVGIEEKKKRDLRHVARRILTSPRFRRIMDKEDVDYFRDRMKEWCGEESTVLGYDFSEMNKEELNQVRKWKNQKCYLLRELAHLIQIERSKLPKRKSEQLRVLNPYDRIPFTSKEIAAIENLYEIHRKHDEKGLEMEAEREARRKQLEVEPPKGSSFVVQDSFNTPQILDLYINTVPGQQRIKVGTIPADYNDPADTSVSSVALEKLLHDLWDRDRFLLSANPLTCCKFRRMEETDWYDTQGNIDREKVQSFTEELRALLDA